MARAQRMVNALMDEGTKKRRNHLALFHFSTLPPKRRKVTSPLQKMENGIRKQATAAAPKPVVQSSTMADNNVPSLQSSTPKSMSLPGRPFVHILP